MGLNTGALNTMPANMNVAAVNMMATNMGNNLAMPGNMGLNNALNVRPGNIGVNMMPANIGINMNTIPANMNNAVNMVMAANMGKNNNGAINANMMNAANMMMVNGVNNGAMGNIMTPNNIGNIMGLNTNAGMNMKCKLA